MTRPLGRRTWRPLESNRARPMAETITLHHSAVAGLDRLAWSGWRIRLPVRRSAGQLRLSAPGQPLLIYGKSGFRLQGGNDVIEVPPPDGPAMGRQVGQRDDAGMALIVERFARWGQVVLAFIVCSLSGVGFVLQSHYSRFRGAPRPPFRRPFAPSRSVYSGLKETTNMDDGEQVQVTPQTQPPKDRGIVYVLSNPAMEGYIKVGVTLGSSVKDVQDRMRQLDTTGVPRAFNCEYAALVDNYQQVEEALLTAFGENRVRSNREFLEGIPPFRVKAILKLQEIADVTPGAANVDAGIAASDGDPIEKPVRAPAFRFSMAWMSIGDELYWADDEQITCKVVADNLRVEYGGEEYSLSRLTAHLKGWSSRYAQVGPYWLNERKTLGEWRDEYLATRPESPNWEVELRQ